MPTPLTPRKHLPAPVLRSSLTTTKPIILSEAPDTSTSTRGARSIPTSNASSSSVRSLAWSPLGNLIATADSRCCRVWNPEKPGLRFSTELKPSPSQAGQSGAATATGPGGRTLQTRVPPSLTGTERVAWNPTREAELATVGNDGVVRFWDVRARGACVGSVNVGGEGYSLCWRPDGDDVVVGRKDDTVIPISRRTLTTLAHHAQPVQTNQIAFSNSGSELFLTTGDSQVKIVDYPSMDVLTTLLPHTSSVTSVSPSPTGRHIALGGSDALLTLWSTTSLCCVSSFTSLPGPVRNLSFSWDGAFVVAGCDDAGSSAAGAGSSGGAGGYGGANAGAAAGGPGAPQAGGAGGGGGGGGSSEETGVKVYGVETGDEVAVVETKNVPSLVEWHPMRYALAWAGEAGGVRVLSL